MSKEKAAGFTRAGAERILSAVSRIEGVPVADIPSVDRTRLTSEPISLPFLNQTGEIIPPFGVFRFGLSIVFDGGKRPMYSAIKSKPSNLGLEAGVNGANPCEVGKVGQMQTGSLVKVRWETPTDWPFPDRYPYAGVTCGATDTYNANFYGYDFVAKGVASQTDADSPEIETIIAKPIPKSDLFQVQLVAVDDDDSLNGTAEEPAQFAYNVSFLKTGTPVQSLQPIIRAGLNPNLASHSSWRRPKRGRVDIATRGIGAWKTYEVNNQEDRTFDLVFANERSQFTTC
tara:strand:+ start:2927 stop:3784 length:858 start_codon:yes stop_codon:yes gene_type:complete